MDLNLVSSTAHAVAKHISPIFVVWKIRTRKTYKFVQFSVLIDAHGGTWVESKDLRFSLERIEAVGNYTNGPHLLGTQIRRDVTKRHGDIDLFFPGIGLRMATTKEFQDTMIMDGSCHILEKFLIRYLDLVKEDWKQDLELCKAFDQHIDVISRHEKLSIIMNTRIQYASFAQVYMDACLGKLKNHA